LNKKITIILLVILAPLAWYLWPTSFGGDAEFLIVQGQSMFPTILPGSLVITKKAPEYHVDDIVSFRMEEDGRGKIVVHRIMDVTEKGFEIKGDNNPKKDPGFPTFDEIGGKVIFATPYFGDMMLLIRNPIVLVGSTIVMGGIQYAQKKRKKKMEKIRRIRLGLAFLDTEKQKKAPTKPDYKIFFVAILVNVITYVILQLSINYDLRLKGDMVTGFLFKSLESSFASTIIFGLYLVFIFGLYFAAKTEEKRRAKKSITMSGRRSKTMQLLMQKNFYPVLVATQFICMMFILMSMFHIMAIGGDLVNAITCDPTQELC
jgi:signal peptidase I